MVKKQAIPKYNFKSIEKRWQKQWEEKGAYQPDVEKARKPFYNLMMFPYPSAEGLHVGNMYAFTGADVYGRFKKLEGYDVFEPIGLDGFGIHSENYAMKIGEHIKDVSKRSEKNFYRQLREIGNMYDWSRTVETYKPEYYKWTQWIFLQMYRKGLAYQKEAKVNWCPSCKTVLSDEQVIAGQCERCDSLVEKKVLKQWFFKITAYADKLLKNLDWIDWPEDVKTNQRNWIGRSVGATIQFPITPLNPPLYKGGKTSQQASQGGYIKVFTTRPDTLFGATYMVVSPEWVETHCNASLQLGKADDQGVDTRQCLVSMNGIENWSEVEKYVKKALAKTEEQRKATEKQKTGVELKGLKAVNSTTKKEIPIWVADYVLGDYGTGAIMAVPAHDERDFEFAKKYKLPNVKVIKNNNVKEKCFTGDGVNINSEFLDRMETPEAKKEMIKWLVKTKNGKKSVDYKLRDWCISRQRYWGPPIPMIHCDKCGVVPVPEKDLPVKLPPMKDFLPEGKGKGPLAKNEKFVKTKCPVCGGEAERETDVSDPFLDSAWYFFRYPSTEFNDVVFDKKRTKKWLPVDSYIGGREHTVLHLLYSRFMTMVLKDLGQIDFDEPYKRFFGHGLITNDGVKMSKSKGNVVNPDDMIKKYGADTVRLYLRFVGDFSQGGDWRDSGIEGMHKFIIRMWKVFHEISSTNKEGVKNMSMIDKTIKVVGEDIEKLSFNTAVARIMEYVNWLRDNKDNFNETQAKKAKETLAFVIAPMAPHVAEELWLELGNKKSIFEERWPKFNPRNIIDETFELVIQVNGKVRDKIVANKDVTENQATALALESEKVQKHLNGKKPRKVIYVKGRLVSVVM